MIILVNLNNFKAWKYMISLKKKDKRFQFQREMRLKSLHQKKLVKAKKIIVDSIMGHIVPQVSYLKTPNMFDSLTKLLEGKNINRNMTLRK